MVAPEWQERKIKKGIYKLLRPVLPKPSIGQLTKGGEDEERLLDLEFTALFGEQDPDEDEQIYRVQIVNNLTE